MSDIKTETGIIFKNELYDRYNWFYQNFLPAVQTAGDEFFSELFSFKLMSLSKNVNILFQGDDYFVTKIRINKYHDAFFRCSSDAVDIILNRVLGSKTKFNLTNVTELEAKIISSFNDYLYESISKFISPPPPKTQKRKNLDMIHLTFFIKDKKTDIGAKFIVSIPEVLLSPEYVQIVGNKFDVLDFKACKVEVKIKVGTTKFLLKEVKNLEKEDIVVFENSDIHSMKLVYKNVEKEFKISPNIGLITSANNNGGHSMEENSLSQDLWDNIQVEMGAEFEKVKITLGELKNIEQGLVVDISSVYDNKITLRVENKAIAKGELVIINDRYGVRIDEIFASEKIQVEPLTHEPAMQIQEEDVHQEDADSTSDEEFDYSDFELDDQDI